MAGCMACGRGFEPGDRTCRACGAARGTGSGRGSGSGSGTGGASTGRPSALFEPRLVVEPASPWAAPPNPFSDEAPRPAAPPVVLRSPFVREAPVESPATLADDGSLHVEVVDDADDEGHDGDGDGAPTGLHRDPPAPWVRWARRVAVAAVAVTAVAAAGTVVARRGGADGLTVQLVGGTVAVSTDHVDAPVERWRHAPADGDAVVMAVQDAGAVYVLSRAVGDVEELTVEALDGATGAVRWTYDVTAAAGTIHPTPQGLVLNAQDDRAVGATMLDLADGTVRWQLDGFVSQVPGSPRYGIVQQVDGRVVLGLQVIDLATGTERWTPAGSLRSGLGLDVLVDANCDAVIGRSVDDGLERWRVVPLDGGTFCERNRPQLTVAADRIVVAEGSELVGIDAEGRETWRQDIGERVLAGSNGPFVQLRRPDAVADQVYLDATSGEALTDEAQQRLDSARRDRTVLARVGDETVVLLDTDAGVVRADRATAAVEGAPMAGAGAVGLGRTTVYRLDDAGDALLGYDLASGAARWTVAVTGASDGGSAPGSVASTPRVFSADRLVIVGTATGDLVAFG